jgi:NAD dependent epimerase/dehydratase family enzyme
MKIVIPGQIGTLLARAFIADRHEVVVLFSIDVARSWEQAAEQVMVPQTRKVLLRSAMTMSPDRGGVFDVVLGLVRGGLGGTSGDGRQ